MEFYHNLITEKSWRFLQQLKKRYRFILIGGWAVFLYTKALRSKDIDLVLDFSELEKLREEFSVIKNERLRKYGVRVGEIEIDVYLPFYSNLGLPAEDLEKYGISTEGFRVVKKEILAILKLKAFRERADSVKGRKDLIDLISLFRLTDFDWLQFQEIVLRYQLKDLVQFGADRIRQTREIEELGLNVHQFSRLKKKILPLSL